eukprot:CAMPEP_0202478286 /NCGR_PEP_ID=MMETSP1360-20130828/94381_1 /ASSEMBLY_ACC=CAM_ASM_000848 /TAXON_ID=515479 /ORGANISM="Licmophora paradoxa, Strain CCMP2313" /LENGTH=456 /DNA_ID=CAMNT_0049105563 /DNA_START=1162 /DNA_END=2532 /DNA_ORIENTATION=+
MRQALNSSVRATPTKSSFAFCIEVIAAVVAVSNFVYVILLTSEFQADWFDIVTFPAGVLITLLGVFELLVRFNPFHLLGYTPSTRLNSAFDGLATLAAFISCYGIVHYYNAAGNFAIGILLTGRAIDMVRIMRFFKIFRDVVNRSSVVFPALAGPVALVWVTHHLFVYAGMSIWGGTIDVGAHEGQITPLYDLNNFNSYWEGLVTMFQVLVVNDWHAIAEVYLYAEAGSSPYIVYPFFVGANLIAVCIMLNCLTAFFVGAFVTKLNEGDKGHNEVVTSTHKRKEFMIDSSRGYISKTISSSTVFDEDRESGSRRSADSTSVEFEVFEKEGFDKIMRTVAGGEEEEDDDFAKELCKILEIFESLSPTRQKVGYIVCCQQTLNRYGNKRFQTLASGFMDESTLHTTISDMHAELTTSIPMGTSVHRSFSDKSNEKNLEITGSLIRDKSPISLFACKVQ